jgi:hypothetical protein
MFPVTSILQTTLWKCWGAAAVREVAIRLLLARAVEVVEVEAVAHTKSSPTGTLEHKVV